MFVRYGQFKANLYQQNPTDGGFFPLSGSNRYGLSIAGDSVWVMSKKTTVNVRGSFYNMTDEFYNPSLLLGDSGLQDYWPNNSWYSSLYNSGYVYFNSTLTAQSSDTPDIVNSGNQWASFLLGALDGQTSARLVPLQTPRLMGYSAYFQDDLEISDRLTLNLGLRWEFEPGPTDPENRLSQRFDLTQPVPEMQATPPNIPAQVRQLMASKGYDYRFNGAWIFPAKTIRTPGTPRPTTSCRESA